MNDTVHEIFFDFDKIEELSFSDIAPDKIKDLTFITKFFKRSKVADPHKKYLLETNLKKIVFTYTDLNQEITIDIKELLEAESYSLKYFSATDIGLSLTILDRIEMIVRNSLGKEKIKSLKK